MSAQPDKMTMERELEAAGWVCSPTGVPNWPETSPWRSPHRRVTAPNMAAAWQLLQQKTDPKMQPSPPRCPSDTDGDGNCPRHPDGCPSTWAQLAYWLSADWGDSIVSLHVVHDKAGDWSVSAQFGREAPDSPMAGGALYGYGSTPQDAIQEALNDLSPYSRGVA